jgi:hypothetical protein
MQIPLDEKFPADFAKLLAGQGTTNVHSQGWTGIKNGELLRRAHGLCEVFVTLDCNIEFQQNIAILSFGDLTPHIPVILRAANQLGPGRLQTVGA